MSSSRIPFSDGGRHRRRTLRRVTGPQNLVASVVCHDHADLNRFISTRFSTLDGLGTVDVVPAVSTVEQATSPVDHDILLR